jgi:hypothetical protein
MKAEYVMLARQFGPLIARFEADVAASQELFAILEWRFSKLSGVPRGSPDFDAAVEPVRELTCEVANAAGWDDESRHLDPLTAPTEDLYGDMPWRLWMVEPVRLAGRCRFRREYIRARTDVEAMRLYEINHGFPDEADGWHTEAA